MALRPAFRLDGYNAGSQSIVSEHGLIIKTGPGGSTTTAANTDNEFVVDDFTIQTNTTYTFMIDAFARDDHGKPSADPYQGATYALATIDPTFSIDPTIDPGATLSDFRFVGLPDAVDGDRSPPVTPGVPEPSTWAMLLAGSEAWPWPDRGAAGALTARGALALGTHRPR